MDIRTKKKIVSAQTQVENVLREESVVMKSDDSILNDMRNFPTGPNSTELSRSEGMPFNIDGGPASNLTPDIQRSKLAASNRISDANGRAEWEEGFDEALADDEIMNMQIGSGYTPDDDGFLKKDAFDSLDVDSSDEIVGDEVTS